jgi:thiamine-monophosphate kinase
MSEVRRNEGVVSGHNEGVVSGHDEFGLIARHLRPLAGPGGLDLLDDAALLAPPPGRELVLTADAMVEGVHFLPEDPAGLVARKLLRVNLSDLAAKGAAPLGYLLTLSARRGTPDAWFAAFAAGLAEDQAHFGIVLLGGDTTSTPGALSLSLTAIGSVAPGGMVRRAGARPGDGVFVTGTIGDGALGLLAIRGEVPDPDEALAGRYRLPLPRLGLVTPALVRASMDVSDGLVQDLGHLCRASGVGAEVQVDRVPLSPAARAAGSAWLETCITGGDDYELLLAVAPEREAALRSAASALGVAVTRIGSFDAGAGVRVLDGAGRAMSFRRGGWSHF